MNNKNLTKVLNEININKVNAEAVAERNLEKCMENEEYNKLEYEIRSLIFEMIQKEVNGVDTSKESETYNNLLKSQDLLLEKLGYTRDDFIPKYKCTKCNDTGYVQGKLCDCVKAKYNKLQKENSSYSKIIDYRLKDFNPSIYKNEDEKVKMKKLYTALEKYCNNFPNVNKLNLILSGQTGVGKTYIASAIANELIDKNFFVTYLTAFELNQIFLSYHLADIKNKGELLDNLLSCDMLVIDDLGTEPMLNNVTKDYLFLLLNQRLVDKKHVVVSTNLSVSGILDRYGERIFSRLCDKKISQFINIDNNDLRLK